MQPPRRGSGVVVFISSVNALGVFLGEADPDYLPIDDAHPQRPRNVYGLSKLLAEEACRYFTNTADMTTVCLRSARSLATRELRARPRPLAPGPASEERHPSWEDGTFIVNVRDLNVCHPGRHLLPRSAGTHRLLVCGPDISADGPLQPRDRPQPLPGRRVARLARRMNLSRRWR